MIGATGRAMRVLCCLVAARQGVVTERYLRAACEMTRRRVHESIHDLRADGWIVLRERGLGWLLVEWPPHEIGGAT